MPSTNKLITNVVGGELSPLVHGRVDLPLFQKGLARCENFIVLPQGGAKYRTGTKFVKYTRQNKLARFIPFQFSDQQSYLIEATDLKFRFYKDNGVVLETAKTISNTSNQSNSQPIGLLLSLTYDRNAKLTVTGHEYSNGDEVFITGQTVSNELNDRFFLVANKTTDTFELTDIFGNAIHIDIAGTGGTVARVYEITTPYQERHLNDLQFAQNADTMYIAHKRYQPGKLTRAGHADWTLNNAYTRTVDPFNPTTLTSVTGSTATPSVFTASNSPDTGDVVYCTAGSGGASVLVGKHFIVTKIDATTFKLTDDITGSLVHLSTSGTGITLVNCEKFPGAVAFTDTGRVVFGGSTRSPETLWFSKAPTSNNTDFDDFTTGIAATDAIIVTFTPVHGKVDSVQWISNTNRFLVVGTFSSIRRCYGATEQEPISPTSFTAKSINAIGCFPARPISDGDALFYIERSGKAIRSIEYDFTIDSYVSIDRNLVAEHLSRTSGVKQISSQVALPDSLWAVRNDGKLLGLTYKQKEDISGWHRHTIGGVYTDSNGVEIPFAKALWSSTMLRPGNTDQLWLIVERTINGNTVRSIEYFADELDYYHLNEFYTDPTTQSGDVVLFENAMYELQKGANYVDMASEYDGSQIFDNTLTFTSDGFQADASIFTSNMVGREIWKAYDSKGVGGGRARIRNVGVGGQPMGLLLALTYENPVSDDSVSVDLLTPFNNRDDLEPGKWYLTTDEISGLEYLEGETVTVVADGGPVDNGGLRTVTDGVVSLSTQASRVQVGYGYRGIIESLNIDSGGITGSAQAKPRLLDRAVLRFLNTGGINVGTSEYSVKPLIFRSLKDRTGRPSPLFTGNFETNYVQDKWQAKEKKFVLVQSLPIPCTILAVDLFMETTDEQ